MDRRDARRALYHRHRRECDERDPERETEAREFTRDLQRDQCAQGTVQTRTYLLCSYQIADFVPEGWMNTTQVSREYGLVKKRRDREALMELEGT